MEQSLNLMLTANYLILLGVVAAAALSLTVAGISFNAMAQQSGSDNRQSPSFVYKLDSRY